MPQKYLLTLLLVLGWMRVAAQSSEGQQYTDSRNGYRLKYPAGWFVQEVSGNTVAAFYAGESPKTAQARASLQIMSLRPGRRDVDLLQSGEPDSVLRTLQALPGLYMRRFEQQDAGGHQEVRYDYIYTPAAGRTHVVGRRLWRNGQEYRFEYQALVQHDDHTLAAGRQLIKSLSLLGPGQRSRRYADQPCDDKMYAIAALRQNEEGNWEDDCRTLHEFGIDDPSDIVRVHNQVLPFQSYALAKGFDNCLYSVTKAPSDAPEYVYRYDPATRQGRYTPWQLPAQGPENIWISGATDSRGDLYFITSDASRLVRVSPTDNSVSTVWNADPIRQASYYSAIGFAGAGTHANFCLDENDVLYQIYSTQGSLMTVDLRSRKASPELIEITGLPHRGGYSDVLIQNDNEGSHLVYLAGPQALYAADLDRQKASRIRKGVYTDLAGCNVFRQVVNSRATAPPPPPSRSPWQGRVLDAITYQPLPATQLTLTGFLLDTTVALGPQAHFRLPTLPGRAYSVKARLPGYLPADTTLVPLAGPFAQDILLRPVAQGSVLRLDKVQFEQGRTILLASSYPELDRLLALLLASPKMTIELRGHTDNVGDPQKNVLLSEQRVAVVKEYLVGHGVAAERITGIGLGGAEPRASNEQESTRRLNRRVEFRVTSGK